MSRSFDERVADVRRLLRAAQRVHDDRTRFTPVIARTTGLSPAGVELGFASLEREASDAELRQLIAAAGDARSIHVVLSANVFVGPLRALAVARAAAPRVTVRPSSRDPVLTRALVDAARDDAISIVPGRDVAASDADEIHVYGRDDTVNAVVARARPGVRVRRHGAGMGVAVITRTAALEVAAEALARDVVTFDQRGCLSPRVVLVEGDSSRGMALASALDERLVAWAASVPRGSLADDERAAATRWREALAFAGHVWTGAQHTIALAPPSAPLAVPPPGRHVHVAVTPTLDELAALIAAVSPHVVAVGTDDPGRVSAVAPRHARLSTLGRMQRPPLDGPVDLR